MKARADFASSELGWLLVTGLTARFASSAEETEMHVSESQQARRLRMAVQPPTNGRAVTIPSAARPRRQIEESHFAQSRRDSRTQPRVAAAHPGWRRKQPSVYAESVALQEGVALLLGLVFLPSRESCVIANEHELIAVDEE